MQGFPVIAQRNRLLLGSGLLNLLLLGICGYFASRPAASRVSPESAKVLAPRASGYTRPAGRAMRWAQLEAADYTVYISNLRKFGCPPETIRDIIIGDVESLFAEKRKEIQDESWAEGSNVSEKIAAENQEELDLIGQLLGPEARAFAAALRSGGEKAYDATPAPAQAQPQQDFAKPAEPPTMPLALVPPDPSLSLNQNERDRLETLRKEFVDAMGGPGQNPAAPEYLKRWQDAQEASDEQLRVFFGQDLYYQLELHALHSGAKTPGQPQAAAAP